jgi:hypothetical protein
MDHAPVDLEHGLGALDEPPLHIKRTELPPVGRAQIVAPGQGPRRIALKLMSSWLRKSSVPPKGARFSSLSATRRLVSSTP